VIRRILLLIALCSLLLAAIQPALAAEKPVKVFILAGQSNMEGKAKISLLEYQLTQPKTRKMFQHLRKDGKWVEREDVWIKFLNRKGNLTVGFGSPKRFGPEWEFGNTVGNHYDEQVLIIKTAWGGKSLFRDFRPPSSGLPSEDVLKQLLERARKRRPKTTLEDVKASFGKYYRMMIAEVNNTLGNLKTHFPSYQGQGYQIAGFVWFQGWNDMINPRYTAEYTENMANFIRDVRKDLKQPELPFVIGQLGVGGVDEEKKNRKKERFKAAQAAAAKLPEFQGNIKVVRTDVLWDKAAAAVFKKGWRKHLEEWNKVGSDYPFHYLGSTITFSRIGREFGKAMLELRKHRGESSR